jgi:dTMP kinase
VSDPAPFIPSTADEQPIPPAPWRVFSVPGFTRLFAAQVVSSLGDWTALLAVLSLANEVSTNAVGFVMIARMLPGFLLAPLGGALVDRWNRKVVMVSADIGRACLIAVLPFWSNMAGLIVISFALELLTLLWGPAKDATVPNIVKDPDQLASANSLGVVAAFGTMPLGAVMFALLAAVASWLGGFEALDRFRVEQASLALWVDAGTFLLSAFLISGLALPRRGQPASTRPPPSQTWHDMVDGLRYIRANPLVRGVMIGLAGGLIGGGAIIPLGAVFADDILHADQSAFGFLTTALGVGAAIGVVTLLWLQRRLPRARVFTGAVITAGLALVVLAWVSTLAFAILLVAFFGAAAGCSYVTGFTLLQESVQDEMRGRIFATLYTVVRVCLLLALTIGPFVVTGFDAITGLFSSEITVGSAHLALPGVRMALWAGGALTVLSGLAARRRMRKATRVEAGTA